MPAPLSHPARAPHELSLLLTLATVQFTHIVDFMVIMPLGPQFMRLFDMGPREFGLLISSYTFAAAVSGFVAAFWIDRFDRKRALLALYAGFIVATMLVPDGVTAAASGSSVIWKIVVAPSKIAAWPSTWKVNTGAPTTTTRS